MIYVKSTDGVRIAVRDLNPQGKKTAVLVHGWLYSHEIFEYQTDLLLSRDWRVVMPDLRGYGESDVPAFDYTYNQMSKDLYQVVRGLKLCSFTLAGYGMGGSIALRYLRKYRSYGAEKLVLISAPAPCWLQRPDFPKGLTGNYVDQLILLAASDRPRLCEGFTRQVFANPHSDASLQWYQQLALCSSGIGTVRTAMCMRDEDGRADLNRVTVPVRILHGGKDRIVPPELAELQHQSLPDSKLFLMENSGHCVLFDELDRFNRHFLEAMED